VYLGNCRLSADLLSERVTTESSELDELSSRRFSTETFPRLSRPSPRRYAFLFLSRLTPIPLSVFELKLTIFAAFLSFSYPNSLRPLSAHSIVLPHHLSTATYLLVL
jgi:hypothetical protein